LVSKESSFKISVPIVLNSFVHENKKRKKQNNMIFLLI
jgi:hypothetical protein